MELRYRHSSVLIRDTNAVAIILTALLVSLLYSCSSTKHVPDGKYLLDKVSIHIDGDTIDTDQDLYYFLRQTPNHKVLGFAKLQLATYSLSGRDSTKWYNRWLRKIGQEPVIYSHELTAASARQLRQALINRGYLEARVVPDTIVTGNKRMTVNYEVYPGRAHYISSVDFDISDTTLRRLVMADTAHLNLRPGAPFDRNSLDNDRSTITESLRNAGYYAFNKDDISFVADTTQGSKAVELTMVIHRPKKFSASMLPDGDSIQTLATHPVYYVRHIYYITDPDNTNVDRGDTLDYHSITVIYGKDHYIKPAILEEKCYIRPGEKYSAVSVDRTYEALGSLGILKFINIEMVPVAQIDNEIWLDAIIRVSRNKKQGITVEIEGTNSEGDLGFGAGVIYQHRNLAKSSNLLTAKLRGAYESLSGNFDGLINDRFTEVATEVGITLQIFYFPFLSRSF